jgi:hypothetical protein
MFVPLWLIAVVVVLMVLSCADGPTEPEEDHPDKKYEWPGLQ